MTLDGTGAQRSAPPPGPTASDVRPLVRAIVAKTLKEAPSHPDVEDATQEAVRKLLEASDRSPALAVTIARNVAIDVLRARMRQRAREGEPEAELVLPDHAPLADERLARKEEMKRTEAALRALPETQREALLLLVTEDMTYEDIGRRLDAPVGTVASWILRARKSIARALAGEKEKDR